MSNDFITQNEILAMISFSNEKDITYLKPFFNRFSIFEWLDLNLKNSNIYDTIFKNDNELWKIIYQNTLTKYSIDSSTLKFDNGIDFRNLTLDFYNLRMNNFNYLVKTRVEFKFNENKILSVFQSLDHKHLIFLDSKLNKIVFNLKKIEKINNNYDSNIIYQRHLNSQTRFEISSWFKDHNNLYDLQNILLNREDPFLYFVKDQYIYKLEKKSDSISIIQKNWITDEFLFLFNTNALNEYLESYTEIKIKLIHNNSSNLFYIHLKLFNKTNDMKIYIFYIFEKGNIIFSKTFGSNYLKIQYFIEKENISILILNKLTNYFYFSSSQLNLKKLLWYSMCYQINISIQKILINLKGIFIFPYYDFKRDSGSFFEYFYVKNNCLHLNKVPIDPYCYYPILLSSNILILHFFEKKRIKYFDINGDITNYSFDIFPIPLGNNKFDYIWKKIFPVVNNPFSCIVRNDDSFLHLIKF